MKLKILITSFLLFLLVKTEARTWQALPSAPTSWRMDDMYFITPQKGWAINPYYSYLTPRQYGRIFTTNDGGQTWTKLVDSSKTFFRSIGFADSLHGWVGNLGALTTDTNFMYETADGGRSWNPVTNVTGPKPKGICGISVVNDSVIYAYGRYMGPAIIMKTTNKGLSWTSQDLSSTAQGLIDGHFINADTGFISGSFDSTNKAQILGTVDGGATWQVKHRSSRVHETVWKLSFPSRQTGYAAIQSHLMGTSPSDTSYFLKTTDGGMTWQEHVFKSDYFYSMQGIGFLNDSTGWIGGDNGHPENYKTTDGGQTWFHDPSFGIVTPLYATGGYSMNRFRRFGDSLMYASGNTIYKYGNYTNGVMRHDRQASIQVYPNPFSGHLSVHFVSGGQITNAFLSVSDITGRIVLKDKKVAEGTNTYPLHGLSKGLFFYKIVSGSTVLNAGTLMGE